MSIGNRVTRIYSWQIYRKGGGQGQAIRAKGRPLLVDAKTLPFQMGLGRGFSGKGKINTIRFIKDLLGAAGLGANAFKNGHDTKLIDIAVEAVKGKADGPAINVGNTNSIEQQLESKTIIIELNTDSSSMSHFEVENNANNRALGNRAGFRWLREVKGRNVK